LGEINIRKLLPVVIAHDGAAIVVAVALSLCVVGLIVIVLDRNSWKRPRRLEIERPKKNTKRNTTLKI
jgi:hypothetical protein